MKGKIRPTSREKKCSKCKERFQEIPKIGFICPDCHTTPKRYLIDLHWQGKRLYPCSDKQGQSLDSYQRALTLLLHINWEIENHVFEPSKYVRSELKEFWATTLLERFLTHKLKSVAPSNKKSYEKIVSRSKEFFGNTDVREIRKYNVVQFKEWLEELKDSKGGRVLGDKSVKNSLDNFKTFLRWLRDDLEIISTVAPFPTVDVQPYSWAWFSSDDQINILSKIDDGDRPIIAFLMLHGIRPGEARALKVKQVNIDIETVVINSTFSGTEIREKRKGRGAKPVEIPIHPEMIGYFRDRVNNNLPEAFMFTNPRSGNHYTETTLRRVWDKARKDAGVSPGVRLYDATRHSVASQLANQNVSVYHIQNLLGHTTIKTTEKYMHKNISSLKTALSNLSLQKEPQNISTLKKEKK